MTVTLTPAAPEAAGDDAGGFAVRVRGLTKTFGRRTAVDRLDLDLPTGVVCGFVGPNGAGKTTTIRMLLGLVRPTAGVGTVLGRSLGDPSRYLSQVGALIEGPAFAPGLSGLDNLRVHARAGGLPLDRVPEVLDRVGLAGRGRDRYRTYSLGMKQRLGIAAALLPRPRLLLLDEPTNGLDPAGIAQTRELLAGFREDGVTVLVSSHLLSEIEQVADHLLLIQGGRSVFAGPVTQLVRSRVPRIEARPERPEDAALAVLAGVATALALPSTVDGDRLAAELPATVTDAEADAVAAELNRRAHAAGVVLAHLAVRRPTLEEAFFELTGAPDDAQAGR